MYEQAKQVHVNLDDQIISPPEGFLLRKGHLSIDLLGFDCRSPLPQLTVTYRYLPLCCHVEKERNFFKCLVFLALEH